MHQQTKKFSIHEHQSMEILNRHGIRVPKCQVATTPDQVYDVASTIGTVQI